MSKGHMPLVYRACPTIEVLQARTPLETTHAQAIDLGVQRAQSEHAIAILLGKPPADGVVDTMIKAFDRLAKRVSRRRGGSPAPHPSPVEAA
jgi:outer membrane protein TolC